MCCYIVIKILDIIVIVCEQVPGVSQKFIRKLKDQYGLMIPTDTTEDLA